MTHSVEEVIKKLNITQLKSLIVLYGLQKPHSRSTKNDYVNYILSSGANLDSKMLINYFSLNVEQNNNGVLNINKTERAQSPSKKPQRKKKIDSIEITNFAEL